MPFIPDVSWPGFLYCFDLKYLESRGVDYTGNTGDVPPPTFNITEIRPLCAGMLFFGSFYSSKNPEKMH